MLNHFCDIAFAANEVFSICLHVGENLINLIIGMIDVKLRDKTPFSLNKKRKLRDSESRLLSVFLLNRCKVSRLDKSI